MYFKHILKFLFRKSFTIQSNCTGPLYKPWQQTTIATIPRPKYKNNYKTTPSPFLILAPYIPAFLTSSTNDDDNQQHNNNDYKFRLQSDVEENILHLMTLAQIAISKGESERAETILMWSLSISEEYENYFALPYIYDILVVVAFSQRDYVKAETLLTQGIERLIQIGALETGNRIVDFQLRLARIYSANPDKTKLAEVGFTSCLKRQQTKIMSGDCSPDTGMLYVNVLYWYGYHKLRNADYNRARELVETAYSYSQKIRSLSAYQEMVILYTLADLHTRLEDYNVALKHMQSALMMAKGIGSVDLPSCYVKLARIYVNLGSWENARQSALEGLKLAELFNEKDIRKDAQAVLDGIKKHEK